MVRQWRVLVVDDDLTALKMISALLTEDGYEVRMASNGVEALEHFNNEGADVILADMKMPRVNGMELFKAVRQIDIDTPFIIMTAFGTINEAVEAVKNGVDNYLIKPLNYDELVITLNTVMKQRALTMELEVFKRMEFERTRSLGFVGNHPAILSVFQTLGTIAPTEAHVLVYGESGVGKELVARAIHMSSHRKEKPLVSLNFSAFNNSLLESELFGYVKGAFANAASGKLGRLELADGGVLFLDDIAQMSLDLQTKLLRFLQEGVFEPVGSNMAKKADVRIVAATSKDLHKEAAEGRFLKDLLYRLDAVSLKIPPLRERREDIPLLVDYFIKQYAFQYNKKVVGIEPRTLDVIIRYDWPDNVRQLENYIMRSVIVCKGQYISIEDLPEHFREVQNAMTEGMPGVIKYIPAGGVTLKDVEMELITKIVEHCNGNKSKAADMLGISRRALYAKMERFGIADHEEDNL